MIIKLSNGLIKSSNTKHCDYIATVKIYKLGTRIKVILVVIFAFE